MDAKYVVRNVVVDSKRSTNVNEAAQQIAFGDLILINKIDMVDADELAEVKRTVRKINRNASWIDCQLNNAEGTGLPDVSQILNVDSFSLEKLRRFDPTFMEPESDDDEEENKEVEQQSATQNDEEHIAETDEDDRDAVDENDEEEELRETHRPKRKRRIHHDNMGICSVGVTARGPLHQWRFNMFMKDFFAERAEDIFRSKGILCIKVTMRHPSTNDLLLILDVCGRGGRALSLYFKEYTIPSHTDRCRIRGARMKRGLIRLFSSGGI